MTHDHSANFELASQAGPVPDHQEPAVVVGSDVWLAVSFGGGTNSTAMLCGMRERGIRPSLITFADTGAEMPHTYEHVAMMRAQVQTWWGIDLLTVRKLYQGKFEGLEGQCKRHGQMPSLAYGHRSCSVKYKHEPQDRALKPAMKAAGVTHAIKAIGFDAGEGHRVKAEHMATKPIKSGLYVRHWYPLVEWGWKRDDCAAAIERHGLPQPGKSSCYFCPAMKRREVMKLREEYPEMLARALAIEDAAQSNTTTHRGLGGAKNRWRDWLAMDKAQARLWNDIEPAHVPCGCYDGSSDLPANVELSHGGDKNL